MALSTFLVHTLAMKKPLTAAAGFAALSLFDLLRFPLVVLPGAYPSVFMGCIRDHRYDVECLAHFIPARCLTYIHKTTDMINYVSKALVSFGRIEAFLEREEVESGSVSSAEKKHDGAPATPALVIRDGAFRWGGSGEGPEAATAAPPTLQGARFWLLVVMY